MYTYPAPVIPEDNQFVVERLLDRRANPKTRHIEYLVRWAGYPPSYDTWESCKNIHPSVKQAFYQQEQRPAKQAFPKDTEVDNVDEYTFYASADPDILHL